MPALPSHLTARFSARLARTRFEELPPRTVHAARRVLLDAGGVMLAASGLAIEASPFIELAKRQGGPPEATILGHGDRVSAASAALANGALAHALDFEDAFDRAPVHPNAASIPALLALAEAHGANGADLLTAIAVGCEVACRLGLALGDALSIAGWYPPPILGAFGATAAAARLLRLDARGVTDAFSLMLLQNSATAAIKHDAASIIRAVREAFPAQAAVQCALLAKQGTRGFESPLDGPGGLAEAFARGRLDPDALLDGLGERWLIEELSFKPWPACRGTHAAIELALALRKQLNDDIARIEEIVIGGGPVQQMLAEPPERKRRPTTAIDAKFSLPFTIATALIRGEVGLDDFTPAALADPDVLRMAARVRFEREPDWGNDQATAGRLRARLGGRKCFDEQRLEALGSPARPLDDAALTEKFIRCAARAARPWDIRTAKQVASCILALQPDEDASRPLDGRPAHV